MKQKRIGLTVALLLIFAAVMVDISQILIEWTTLWFFGLSIFINGCIDILTGAGFWLVFRIKGIKMNGVRAVIFFALGFLKLFPGLDELPLWSLDVGMIILLVKAEDVLYNKVGIANNPVAQKALRGGIMGRVNSRTDNNPALKQRLEGANERSKMQNESSDGIWDKSARHPDPRVEEQRNAKLKQQNAQ